MWITNGVTTGNVMDFYATETCICDCIRVMCKTAAVEGVHGKSL